MTIPCPYCATELFGAGLVNCRGCGNPVALGPVKRSECWCKGELRSRRRARLFPFTAEAQSEGDFYHRGTEDTERMAG